MYRLFYGGHRRYLNPEEVSPIEPPLQFKSKRQLKQLRQSGQFSSSNFEEANKISFHVNFQKKQSENPEEADNPVNLKKFRKVATMVRNTITLDHFSSVQKEDWIEESQAGCKMWVNKQTGEVATECPWKDHLASSTIAAITKESTIQKLLKAKNKHKAVHPAPGTQSSRKKNSSLDDMVFAGDEGTGALVYNGTEIEDLFKILDSSK